MQKTTRILNLCTLVLLVLTGLYVQLTFSQILNDLSLIMVWGLILILAGLQLESTFDIAKRMRFKIVS